MTDELRSLDEFLAEAYLTHDRLTDTELRRGAVAADLPAALVTHLDALPEGSYTQDEAAEALRELA